MKRICIIGSGTIGMSTGMGLIELGNEVVFYDTNRSKVQRLRESGLEATDNLSWAIKRRDFSFVCVPTPTEEGKIDLACVISSLRLLADYLTVIDSHHVVVIRSTLVPTSTENIIIPLLEKYSNKKVGRQIGVCANPEFLTEIAGTWTDDVSFSRTFFSQERVVIGESDRRSGDDLENLYSPIGVPIIRTDIRTAEMIKYASNCALAAKISYWNEIYYVCQKLGIDSRKVADVVGMDKRIGKYGTVHGLAFGGKCLPKDLEAFITFCNELNYDPKLLKAIRELNERIRIEKGVRE